MSAEDEQAGTLATDSGQESPGLLEQAPPARSKSPLYQAQHALRYQRQAAIKVLEASTGRALICYVAGNQAPVDRDDTLGFADLLHGVAANKPIDLLLHTTGGDIDAAEKLMTMIRAKSGTSEVRVIVPDYAKSAGTLMALGADVIVMSDGSELGPIDPQIILNDGKGNRIRHSVQSYLDAYAAHTAALKQDSTDMAAAIMLGKLDPATLKLFEAVRARAQALAEDLLKRGMFREGGNWSQAASKLLDTQKWLSHGQMISWQDAQDPSIGLKVEHVDSESDLWRDLWQLYCLQRLAIEDKQKLFESALVSLVVEGAARYQLAGLE